LTISIYMCYHAFMEKKEYLSIKEYAKVTGRSIPTIRLYIRKGIIETHQILKNGTHYIPWKEVPAFIRKDLEAKETTT